MFCNPLANPDKLGWVFDWNDGETVPDESTEDLPSPSQKLTPNKNGIHTPYSFQWNRVIEATKVGKRQLGSSSIVKKYCGPGQVPAIAQAQPSLHVSPVKTNLDGQHFDIYKYIGQKEYKADNLWHTKDSYFSEMHRSLSYAKMATSNSPKNAISRLSACPFVQKGRRNISKNFKTVIMLDLDETLIRAEAFNFNKTYSHVINVKIGEDQFQNFGVMVRPYATEFLEAISRDHKIVVYTASVQEYAEKVVGVLDPHRKYIDHVLAREHCSFVGGLFVKNLDIGVHHDITLDNIIIVDNYVHSYALHLDQGVPIKPFYGDMNDKELLLLTDVLNKSSQYPRLLDFMRNHLDFTSFYEFLESNYSATQL